MFDVLIGKTITAIDCDGDEALTFHCDDGTEYRMFHQQDCCERVYLDDVVGDLEDLVGNPVLDAYEESSEGVAAKDDYEESFTWTFYRLSTIKGTVVLKWYGASNGWYSESVDFVQTKP